MPVCVKDSMIKTFNDPDHLEVRNEGLLQDGLWFFVAFALYQVHSFYLGFFDQIIIY